MVFKGMYAIILFAQDLLGLLESLTDLKRGH